MSIAYIPEWNFRVVDQICSEEQILVAIMDDIKFCLQKIRAYSLGGIVTERCCHLSNLSFHISRREQFLARKEDKILLNHLLGVPQEVTKWTHFAEF